MHTALKRCSAMRNVGKDERFQAIITSSIQAATSSFKNNVALDPIGPSVSNANGTKICVVDRVMYLFSFLAEQLCRSARSN